MKIVADANIPFVRECFSSIGEVEVVSGQDITSSVAADADVLLVRSITKVDKKLLSGSKVKFVGTATIGFDHVDVGFLQRSNTGFASAPGSNANSAAEYIVAALLEVGQKYKIELEGKSIGVIGVGNVGSKVAVKCQALGMNIFHNDPPLQRQTGDPKYLPLEELLDCDFITLHTPLTFDGVDKTFHFVDEKFFKQVGCALHTKTKVVGLRRAQSSRTDHATLGTVLVNTSRGAVVDSRAIKAAIKTGLLKAVALDVWENEPNIDTELLNMVDIATPHIAGYSWDGKITGMIMIYKAVCKYFGFEPKFDVQDFLPEPHVTELRVERCGDSQQQVILNIVRRIYDIRKDDADLRKISDKPIDERGKYFDELRKNYPIRRELQNTRVIFEERDSDLAEKLKGIGFEIKI